MFKFIEFRPVSALKYPPKAKIDKICWQFVIKQDISSKFLVLGILEPPLGGYLQRQSLRTWFALNKDTSISKIGLDVKKLVAFNIELIFRPR